MTNLREQDYENSPTYDISSMIQNVPLTNILTEKEENGDDYYVWCGSVVKSDDGKFHMYYSRWPHSSGFITWVSESEIAYAVADNVEGPYTHVNVAISARGNEYWDGTTAHNPAILRQNGKYYLYYMGTTASLGDNKPTGYGDPRFWEYRNNQRIGVAVADNPEGPWTRFDKPILDVSSDPTAWDARVVNNPAVAIGEDGKVVMVYKGVDNTPPHGVVRVGVAIADSGLGPFTRVASNVFRNPNNPADDRFLTEDPFVWYRGGKYRALCRDMEGVFTGTKDAIAQFESEDRINWTLSKYPLAAPSSFSFVDGKKIEKIERPWLYMEDGVPKMLFGATRINNPTFEYGSFNVFIPLK